MKILCTTDFSDHSLKAVDYAIYLSNVLKAQLHILTVYDIPRATGSFRSIDEDIRKANMEDLEDLYNRLKDKFDSGNVPVLAVKGGDTINAILDYAKSESCDLIVMGTQGTHSMRSMLFGSVTRKVATLSKIPILAIPHETKVSVASGDKILLALDDKPLPDENIFEIVKVIAKRCAIKVDIIHINSPQNKSSFDSRVLDYLEGLVGQTIVLERDVTPETALKEYANNHSVRLLTMIRREKSFIQKLLTKGHTGVELAISKTPLLIIPE